MTVAESVQVLTVLDVRGSGGSVVLVSGLPYTL